MTSMTRVSIVLALTVTLAAPLRADQKNREPTDKQPAVAQDKKPAPPRDKNPAGPNRQKKSASGSRKGFRLPENVRATLTPEQSEKAAQIQKEYAAKLDEAAATINAILTPERRKAQAEAAARALDALLSDQEKADLKAAQESLGTLQGELRGKLLDLLTDEQKSQLKKQRDPKKKEVPQPSEKKRAGPRDEPLEIGTAPQLFLDDSLVDNRFALTRNKENVLRRFHVPVKYGTQPVLVDRDAAPSYFGVTYDSEAKLFRLWYQANVPVVIGEKTEKGGVMGFRHVRYAESRDGIHWTLPELGMYEFRGSKNNNICFMRPGTFEQKIQGFGTSSIHLIDTAEMPEADRGGYKFLMSYTLRGGGATEADRPQVYLIGSRDGIHWDSEGQKSILTGSISDGWMGMLFDPGRRKYVGFCRPRDRYDSGGPASPSNADFGPSPDPRINELIYSGVVRRIGRIETDELWRQQEAWPLTVLLPDAVDLKNKATAHMSMTAKYYGGAYFGFLHLYDPHESVWTELVFSRDGKSFERTHEAVVSPGAGDVWDSKQTWAVSDWCERGDQWWFYYFGGNSPPNLPFQRDTIWGIGLATIRKEGFVSLAAPASGGVVITRLLRWPDADLEVNCDASHGEMRVRVSNKQRQAYPGFNYSDCIPFTGDSVRHKIAWKNNSLRELKGKEVRLEFYFSKQADIYSFQAAR